MALQFTVLAIKTATRKPEITVTGTSNPIPKVLLRTTSTHPARQRSHLSGYLSLFPDDYGFERSVVSGSLDLLIRQGHRIERRTR
jgi:hypothetical protein